MVFDVSVTRNAFPLNKDLHWQVAQIVEGNEYFVPFGEEIDVEAEKQKLSELLAHTKKFLIGVQRKLQNEKFVGSAPEKVVEIERKKESDSLSKIAILEEKLATLG